MGTGHQIIDEVNTLAGTLSAQELTDYSCAVNDLARNMMVGGANAKAMLQSLGSLKLVRYRKEQTAKRFVSIKCKVCIYDAH